MCTYVNKGNEGFKSAVKGTYIDKTGMIAIINQTLDTERRFTCVTRSRRFGKSMAADMLCAYYDKSCDSRALFEGLSISEPDKEINGIFEDKQYEKHLNKYPVISLDITDFTTKYDEDPAIVSHIQEAIIEDLITTYPDLTRKEGDDLMDVLVRLVSATGEKFIMIIDEWDAICREFEQSAAIVDDYVNMLRRLFKGGNSKKVFAGVYMTGILPIKKYYTQSALNNFREYSVIKPGKLASFFGFLPNEVECLAKRNSFSVEELKEWYDGYRIGDEPSIFNPYSVIEAIEGGMCSSYWSTTGTYDSVVTYINRNFDGLKDDIIKMLAGGRCGVNTTKFQNDLSIINSKDDVLTVLIHLGYLSFDSDKSECYIPNKEVRIEMTNAVEATDWKRLNETLAASEKLLAYTLEGNEDAVAKGIELAHDENTSILSYNDENSLACVLSIAYYFAKNDYVWHRELPTGKGFADIVLIPRKNINSPALVIELKYDKDADTAIRQIHSRNYMGKVSEYAGEVLLVGINYDKNGINGKKHTCKIEKIIL
ncbi:MAG: AAA family ATPase [Prevotellaceae bacterium]|nr:AAA family ATPase [Prevotellaceae bacterium]MDY6199622.1 AAA family ATPase [Prevotella sp.]